MAYIVAIVALALAALFAVLVAFEPIQEARRDAALLARGVAVEGRALALTAELPRNIRHNVRVFRVNYSFDPGAGEIRHAAEYVDEGYFRTLSVGSRLNVIFDPADPSTSALQYEMRPLGTAGATLPRTLVFAALLACIPLGILGIVRVDLARQRRLLTGGAAARAEIVNATRRRRPHGASVVLVYRFVDADGRSVEGRKPGLPLKYLAGPQSPDPAVVALFANPTVLYDPSDSSRNALYPFSLVAVRSASATVGSRQ